MKDSKTKIKIEGPKKETLKPLFKSGEVALLKISKMPVCVIKRVSDDDGMIKYSCGVITTTSFYSYNDFYEVELQKLPVFITTFSATVN